jgi:hypothetical protein
MTDQHGRRRERYRVWLAASGDPAPQGCSNVAPDAVALQPAEPGTMSARQAARYVGAFNRAARARGIKIRAVALPVVVRYDGEPRPGQSLAAVAMGPHPPA